MEVNKKVRGFEFISTKQALEDLAKLSQRDEFISNILGENLSLPKRATKNSAG